MWTSLLLEANHDVRMLQAGAYPYPLKQRILGDKGHLSNERSGQLLGKVLHDHLKHIVLGHLSKENNYPGSLPMRRCVWKWSWEITLIRAMISQCLWRSVTKYRKK